MVIMKYIYVCDTCGKQTDENGATGWKRFHFTEVNVISPLSSLHSCSDNCSEKLTTGLKCIKLQTVYTGQ